MPATNLLLHKDISNSLCINTPSVLCTLWTQFYVSSRPPIPQCKADFSLPQHAKSAYSLSGVRLSWASSTWRMTRCRQLLLPRQRREAETMAEVIDLRRSSEAEDGNGVVWRWWHWEEAGGGAARLLRRVELEHGMMTSMAEHNTRRSRRRTMGDEGSIWHSFISWFFIILLLILLWSDSVTKSDSPYSLW
jgi:hypothetical protein